MVDVLVTAVRQLVQRVSAFTSASLQQPAIDEQFISSSPLR